MGVRDYARNLPSVELLDIIGHEIPPPSFINSRDYWDWEDRIALPALLAAGWVPKNWGGASPFFTVKSDITGPLVRGVIIHRKDDVEVLAIY